MSIFARIREVRDYLNMTQPEFGSAIGIDQSDVSRFENGKVKDVPYTVMEQLHQKYKININWLVAGAGQMLNEVVRPPYIEDQVAQIWERLEKIETLMGISGADASSSGGPKMIFTERDDSKKSVG